MSDANEATEVQVLTIKCEICEANIHSVKAHLKEAHPEVSLEDYQAKFPDADVMSKRFLEVAAKHRAEMERKAAEASADAALGFHKSPMSDVFGINHAGTKTARGTEIPVTVFEPDAEMMTFVPEVDDSYIFDVNLMKVVLMGLEMKIPTYLWGHSGVGKTSMFEQVCARTNRPWIRVQHSINTEECHIVGQWTVKGGETVFELGPLAVAMKTGLTYVADEYDGAIPPVLMVYQAVLEGKPLIIKEADAANRVIRPHKNFRFVATGNTNGTGDETGLYSGTHIGNAANYERFGIVENVADLPPEQEIAVIMGKAKLVKADVVKLVKYATEIREAYAGRRIGSRISTRSMIFAAIIGYAKGSVREGVRLAFTNRMGGVDRETCEQLAQRHFGAPA